MKNLREEQGIDAVVLAGGFGWFHTSSGERQPKVLAELSERETVLSRTMRALAAAGFKRPIVVVQELYQAQLVAEVNRVSVDALVAVQPIANGGALLALEIAMEYLRHAPEVLHVVVVFADMPCWQPETIRLAVSEHIRRSLDVTIGVVDLPNVRNGQLRRHMHNWGRVLTAGNEVRGIVFSEGSPRLFQSLRFSCPSLFVIAVDAISSCASSVPPTGEKRERTLPGLINAACARGKKAGMFLLAPEESLGVNTTQDLMMIRELLKKKGG